MTAALVVGGGCDAPLPAGAGRTARGEASPVAAGTGDASPAGTATLAGAVPLGFTSAWGGMGLGSRLPDGKASVLATKAERVAQRQLDSRRLTRAVGDV